jgi:uncharacterized protein (DUF2141 family)
VYSLRAVNGRSCCFRKPLRLRGGVFTIFLRVARIARFNATSEAGLPGTIQLRHTCVPSHRALLFIVTTILLVRVCPAVGTSNFIQDPPSANSSDGCTLRIHVDGLRNSNGVVGSVLFTSADGWPEDLNKSFRHGPTPIAPGQRQATVVWEHLPPGDYGVAAIHDENRNAKLDRNLIGIPREGFGFANNPHVGLSAPAFRLAVVHVGCPVTELNIHLQYR